VSTHTVLEEIADYRFAWSIDDGNPLWIRTA
jgi:hypothetical protein